MVGSHAWLWYALLSAFFAALTALFAKIGVSRMEADYATFLRTVVVLIFLTFTVSVQASGRTRSRSRAGRCWHCYFRDSPLVFHGCSTFVR